MIKAIEYALLVGTSAISAVGGGAAIACLLCSEKVSSLGSFRWVSLACFFISIVLACLVHTTASSITALAVSIISWLIGLFSVLMFGAFLKKEKDYPDLTEVLEFEPK